jgi:hypothetical protein
MGGSEVFAGSFVATAEDGKQVTISVYQTLIDASHMHERSATVKGLKRLEGPNRCDVTTLGDGWFKLLDMNETRVHSDHPLANPGR